jgi:hypothetical protein
MAGHFGRASFQRGRRQEKLLSRAFRWTDAIERQDTTRRAPAYMISLERGFIEKMARHPGAA